MQGSFAKWLRVFIWVGCVVLAVLCTVLAVEVAIGSVIESMGPDAAVRPNRPGGGDLSDRSDGPAKAMVRGH